MQVRWMEAESTIADQPVLYMTVQNWEAGTHLTEEEPVTIRAVDTENPSKTRDVKGTGGNDKKELDEIKQTIKRGIMPRGDHVTAARAGATESDNDKLILDSAVNLSFLNTTPTAVRPLTVRKNIKTANGPMHGN